jgi:hypothetical protein
LMARFVVAVDGKIDAAFRIVGYLLPNLHPLAFEGLDGDLREDGAFVLELHARSGSQGQVGITHIAAVKFDLVQMAEFS